MISSETAMQAARSLGAVIPFCPMDDIAQTAIADEIGSICNTPEQVQWLIKKMIRTYTTWPGPREMRAAFCSKFRPRDGVEVSSTIYPDGVPSDSEQGAAKIAGPDVLALPPGATRTRSEPVSNSPELVGIVKRAAAAMPQMPSGKFTYDDPVSQKLKDMGFEPPR